MNPIAPNTGPSPQAMIDAFRESAGQGEAVRVVEVDGRSFQVLAEGHLPGSQGGSRSVAWVREDTDTTGMFLNALAQRFGAGVADHIAEALALEPSPGKPLASRLVPQAIDMAETCAQALSGVDFLTQIEHSARSGGVAFRAAAARLGIDSAGLDADTRRLLDQHMQADFAYAAARGESPVPAATATQWLIGHLERMNLPR